MIGSQALQVKHSALTRAKEVQFLRDPRTSESANGWHHIAPIGDRLTAGRQTLNLPVEVRILVPERRRRRAPLSDNFIVDDARGRVPPRPRRCPSSRSGEGACLKRRRCWFDSRGGHWGTPVFRPLLARRAAEGWLPASHAGAPVFQGGARSR